MKEDEEWQGIDANSDEYYYLKYCYAIDIYKELYIGKLSYKEYTIGKFETVFLIEDSLVIFFYRSGKYSFVVQELTLNNIYTFSNTKFINYNCYHMNKYPIILKYISFTGDIYKYSYEGRLSTAHKVLDFDLLNYIDNRVPEIELKKRYLSWSGWDVNFIIFEIEFEGKKGYAVDYTLDSNPLKYAVKREQALEEIALGFANNLSDDDSCFVLDDIENCKDKKEKYILFNNTVLSTSFCKITSELSNASCRKDNKDFYKTVNGRLVLYSGYLNYWVETKNIKDLSSIEDIKLKLFEKVTKSKNMDIEKMQFKLTEYKWKSEELMVECIKKVFPKKSIIKQHKPYFLYVNNGQMSYDAFVCELNIAFEYQGKQHFEPVDYFGGTEAYEKQRERDMLKLELSKKNNVLLIYINYDEDISTKLIKDKLAQNGITLKKEE